jgi:hypothetical protein
VLEWSVQEKILKTTFFDSFSLISCSCSWFTLKTTLFSGWSVNFLIKKVILKSLGAFRENVIEGEKVLKMAAEL